jgi:hypothetical protein
VSHDHIAAPHLSDEDLLLDYYGEATSEQRTQTRAHLESCAECQAIDRELRAVLALVDTEPLPDAPPGFEREMWARLEPHVRLNGAAEVRLSPPRGKRATARLAEAFGAGGKPDTPVRLEPDTTYPTLWRFEFPRWALAASAAALAIGSFALGRAWDTPRLAPAVASVEDARAISERMLRNEVEEHLERSQRVLVEIVNNDDAAPAMLASDRERAADLVAAGRLYRRSVEQIGDMETRDLLEAVERVLVEIANGPEVETSNDLSEVRARINDQDLIFRLRLMTAEMRAREQRARPTW